MKTPLLLALLVPLGALATPTDPPAIEWERLYNLGTSTRIEFITETSDGGFIATMTVIADTVFSLHRLNDEGDILWAAGSDLFYQRGNTATELPGGDFVVAGYGKETESSSIALMIGKYDPMGSEIWTKLYNSSYPGAEAANSIYQLPDGGFAVCGGIAPAGEQNKAWILRTDSQGDTLWTREWAYTSWATAVDILYLDNGLTVFAQGNTPSTPGGPHLLRYDMDGNLLWVENFPEWPGTVTPGAQAMCEASDGGLLLMDNYWPVVCHTDYFGSFDWWFAPPSATQPYGYSIATTMDGGIIYGGQNTPDPDIPGSQYSGMITRHDSSGNELWRDYVYNSGCSAIYSVRQLSQGGYVAAGYAYSSGAGNQGFLIKYAPEMGIEEQYPDASLNLEASPNPFSSFLSVSFSLPEAGNASIRIYDLSGRLVSTVMDGQFPAGTNSVEWAVPEDVSSGCYLIQYIAASGTLSDTIMLIK